MFLAVPKEFVKGYDRQPQRFIGYYGAAPGCGLFDFVDPIDQLYSILKNLRQHSLETSKEIGASEIFSFHNPYAMLKP